MGITIQLPDGQRREFDRDRITIGRGPGCEIQLVGDSSVRDRHARIRKLAGRWLIESLGDWPIQAGGSEPARLCWLGIADTIRLAQDGPELVFEPAHEDVVLAGLEAHDAVTTTINPMSVPTPPPVSSASSSRPHSADSSAQATPQPPPLPTNCSPPQPDESEILNIRTDDGSLLTDGAFLDHAPQRHTTQFAWGRLISGGLLLLACFFALKSGAPLFTDLSGGYSTGTEFSYQGLVYKSLGDSDNLQVLFEASSPDEILIPKAYDCCTNAFPEPVKVRVLRSFFKDSLEVQIEEGQWQGRSYYIPRYQIRDQPGWCEKYKRLRMPELDLND